MSEPMLKVAGLNAFYGRAHILFDVGLEVGRGEVVALMGRNGAGKSTTMKAVMGLLPRRQGEVTFSRTEHRRAAAVQDRAHGHGLRSRRPARVRRSDGDGEPRRRAVSRRAKARRNGRRKSCSACFRISAKCPKRPGGRMSGGEQQMLTVSRTLMGNPYLVLLDEPSEGVAPVIVEQMANMILELKREGLSILLSEQNLHFAEMVSDRAYVA